MRKIINADVLIEELLTENQKCIISTGHELTMNMIVSFIRNQPTAYNVDAVVTELEHQAEQYRNRGFEHEQKGFSAMADKYYGKQWSYLHAIEIVRNGGVKHG